MARALNAGAIRDIRERSKTQSTREIADDYGTSFEQIWRIVNNRIWKWVTDDVPDHATSPDWVKKEQKKLRQRKREAIRRAAGEPLPVEVWRALKQIRDGRLPDLLVLEIRRLADKDWPISIIANRLNLKYTTVYSIAVGRTYMHVS